MPKYQVGGLYQNNKQAYVDSVLAANKQLDWVKRLYEKNAPTIQIPGEPYRSTHLMADNGQGYVFPMIVRQNGKLVYLGNEDAALQYARKTNTGIQLPQQQGTWFANNGYKIGTGVNNDINANGIPFNNTNYQTGGQVPDFLKFRNIQQQPSVDNLHNLVIAANNLQQESRRTAKPQETVRSISKQEFNKKASVKDILTNPITALKYKLHNQDIPANFAAGDRNVYDNALDVVNPMTYVNAATNTINRIIHPVNTVNQIVDSPLRNGVAALGDAAVLAGFTPKTPTIKSTLDDVNYLINKSSTVEGIQPKWFTRELSNKLPENGNFNQGVYNLRRFPNYVAKVENQADVAERMGFPDYVNFNFADAMRNIPDDAPIAKVYNQLAVPNTESRALIMKKLEGLAPNQLLPDDYMSMPNNAYTELYKNLKTIKDNNLAFDYMGDNYLYNPEKQQFQLLDINPTFPTQNLNSMLWNSSILGGITKNNPNLTPTLIKNTIADKLIQDYDRSLYKNYYGEGTDDLINDASNYGTQYLKQAVNNSTQHLNEFKTGGTMKNNNKKSKKFQIAGSNPCGPGTIWDGKQCVPYNDVFGQNTTPVNPDQPNLYAQNNTGTPTNFRQHTTLKQSGQVVPSDVLPLHNTNAMGPFNYENGQLQDQKQYAFDPTAGTHDKRGTFIPSQNVFGDAVDNGFNLDSDGVYRKKQITTDNNALGYNDAFKALNIGLDLTSIIAGKANDAKTIEQERQKLLKARYNQSQYNPYENGVNNVPVYMQNGGASKPFTFKHININNPAESTNIQRPATEYKLNDDNQFVKRINGLPEYKNAKNTEILKELSKVKNVDKPPYINGANSNTIDTLRYLSYLKLLSENNSPNLSIDTTLDKTIAHRSHFNPLTNTITVSGPQMLDGEIAHATQKNLPIRGIQDWFNSPYITDEGQLRQYDIPGSLEHEAHSIIAPKIRQRYREITDSLAFENPVQIQPKSKMTIDGLVLDSDTSGFRQNGGGIHIKKSHEGLFTNEATQAGMSVQQFAAHVLANKDKYSTAVIKRANFAKNSTKFSFGGNTNYEENKEYDLDENEINNLIKQGYEIEYI